MARFQRLACPSCGGALDVPARHEQFFTCATCGATLEDTQYKAPTPQVQLSVADVLSQSALDPALLTSYAVRAGRVATRAGKAIAAITTIGVLGGAGAGAYGVYRGVSDSGAGAADAGGFSMYGFTTSAMFPGEGAETEVALVVHGADGQRLIYVDLGAPEPVRWEAPLTALLPAEASIAAYERVVASSGQVLLTHEDGLYAFDRATGTAVYQIGLSDSVANNCAACLRVFGERAAVLTQDGVLRVWDVATGQGGWTVRLPGDVPRQLLDAGGNPAVVVDQPDDREDRQRALVTTFDVATGAEVFAQAPRCDSDFPMSITAYDEVVELGEGRYVWIDGCPQLWAPGAEAPLWSIPPDGAAAFDVTGVRDGVLVDGERLVVATNVGVVVMSAADGSFVSIGRDELADLEPVGLVGDMVIATEQSARGSRKWSLTGLALSNPDGQAAQPAWQIALDGEPGGDGLITSTEWIVGVTPAGVVVVQFDVNADSVRFQTVDPATGTAAPAVTLTLDDLLFAEFVGWREGNVVLGADQRLLTIDPATATIVSEAP